VCVVAGWAGCADATCTCTHMHAPTHAHMHVQTAGSSAGMRSGGSSVSSPLPKLGGGGAALPGGYASCGPHSTRAAAPGTADSHTVPEPTIQVQWRDAPHVRCFARECLCMCVCLCVYMCVCACVTVCEGVQGQVGDGCRESHTLPSHARTHTHTHTCTHACTHICTPVHTQRTHSAE